MFRVPTNAVKFGRTKTSVAMESPYPTSIAAAAFVPTDVANLNVWLQASSIGQADNTGVSTWTDSFRSQTATQAVSASQPTYKTNVINGLPAVRFNGSGNNLVLNAVSASVVVNFNAGATIFVVCSGSSGTMSGNNAIFCGATTGNDYDAGDTIIMTTGYLGTNTPSGMNVSYRGVQNTNITTAFRSWFYWSYQVSVSGANITQNTNKNGVQVETKTGLGSGNCAPTKVNIGARVATGGAYTAPYYFGDIAEIIVYSTDIGAANIAKVENYLKTKYAL